MIEGLWIVQYEGTAGGDGGVIVFVRGQVLGGDSAFVYTGSYQSDAQTISARVLVRKFNPAVANVLGIKGDFELTVRGTIQGETIKGSASLVNQEGPGMVVKLTRIAALAA
jgi:T3SS negative regulator,GrlR